MKVGYVDPSGFHLYNWVRTQRGLLASGRISMKRARELNALGIHGLFLDEMYLERIKLIAGAKETTGTANLRTDFNINGIQLGAWLAQVKFRARRNQVPERWIEELSALGVVIEKGTAKKKHQPLKRTTAFAAGLARLKEFSRVHGHVRVPQKDGIYADFNLGSWLHLQRRKWREGRLPEAEIDTLSALGVRPRH